MTVSDSVCGLEIYSDDGNARMNDNERNQPIMPIMAAFFIGVILLWSFGKNWLNFESALVFLAGLLGVVVPVLIFGLWKIRRHSDRNGK
jgi:hypothetical protein